MEENREIKECHCDEHHHETATLHMVKFAFLLLAIFLACYLAIYYISDQMRHAYYLPSAQIEDIDRILRAQDRTFNEMRTFPMRDSALMSVNSPVETFKDDESDAYKMIINLKSFDNNPDNIDLDISSNEVKIKGISEKTGKNSDKIFSFSQSFTLPEKIDASKVTKKVKNHKYIITMPIQD